MYRLQASLMICTPQTHSNSMLLRTDSLQRTVKDYHSRIANLEDLKYDLEYCVKRKDFEVLEMWKPKTKQKHGALFFLSILLLANRSTTPRQPSDFFALRSGRHHPFFTPARSCGLIYMYKLCFYRVYVPHVYYCFVLFIPPAPENNEQWCYLF